MSRSRGPHRLDRSGTPIAAPVRSARSSTAGQPEHEQAADNFSGRAARGSGIPKELVSSRRSRGNVLDEATREHMEPLLGTDLTHVRIHSDSRADDLTKKLGAEALTVGNHIYFGAGYLRAGSYESDRLLAHELAHVAQQRRTGTTLQPRLKLTGAIVDRDRAIALLNRGLTLGQVSSDSTGQLSIRRTASGPLTQTEQVLFDRLSAIINDSHAVNMTISSGSRTLVGSYATADIDIADLEQIGIGGIIHEIEEQFQRQVNNLAFGSETTGAHGEAIRTESAVTGMTRGAQRVVSSSQNPDNTINAVFEVPYTFPDGSVKIMVTTIVRNNIISNRFR